MPESRSTPRCRDEGLNEEVLANLVESRAVIERWRLDCNLVRPHSAHGRLTPDAIRLSPAAGRLRHPTRYPLRIAAGSFRVLSQPCRSAIDCYRTTLRGAPRDRREIVWQMRRYADWLGRAGPRATGPIHRAALP